MKNKLMLAVMGILMIATLTSCGKDPELTKFQNDIDTFCDKISEIDKEINNVNATSDSAVNEVLAKLDELDRLFQDFGAMDFPEEFDYLENIADESSTYMTEAVSSYRDAYTNEEHNEATMMVQYEYASENYSRAYKRVQIIIALLHGESPEDVGLVEQKTTESSESSSTN